MRWATLQQLVLTRLREFYREPGAIFWVYGFPLIMVVALGTAFRNRPPDRVHVDVARGPHQKSIVEALASDPRFVITMVDEKEVSSRLRAGKTSVVVITDSDSAAPLAFQYVFDPNSPDGLLARNITDDVLQRAGGRKDVVDSSNIVFDEPGGRYIDYLVPGMIGMGLMGGGLWGVGFAVVNLRMRNLLKRFLATPMRRSDFLLSVTISRMLFTIPEVLVMLLFSRLVFGVACHGSHIALVFLIILGAFEFAGIGLLIACRASTIETVSGLINFVALPMWIGSGVFFGTERFPKLVQPFLDVLPLTPLIHAIRSVMQEGASLMTLGPELGLILLWTVGTFVLALKLFRWN